MSILLITVNYKDSSPTEELINSILKCENNDNLKIIIVDNESSETSFSSLKLIKDNTNLNIDIIRSRVNKYYWGGINLGFKYFLKSGQDYRWLIACNNDIEFDDISFFKKLKAI